MNETPTLDETLAALLAEAGIRPTRITPVTTLGGEVGARQSLHVVAENGEWKARCVSPEVAERFATLRPYLDDACFPRLVGHRDHALLLEWRPGVTPSPTDVSTDVAQRAGATLAGLHARPSTGDATLERFAFPALKWPNRVRLALETVDASGVLSRAERGRITVLMKPGPAIDRPTLVHGDFCPENFAVARDGSVHVIDNESLSVDDRLWDLARVWIRWPMTHDVANAFWTGYGGRPPHLDEALVWWATAACIEAIAFRLRRGADVGPAADPLRRILDHGPPAFAPFAPAH